MGAQRAYITRLPATTRIKGRLIQHDTAFDLPGYGRFKLLQI
jgi:hypothetical protein